MGRHITPILTPRPGGDLPPVSESVRAVGRSRSSRACHLHFRRSAQCVVTQVTWIQATSARAGSTARDDATTTFSAHSARPQGSPGRRPGFRSSRASQPLSLRRKAWAGRSRSKCDRDGSAPQGKAIRPHPEKRPHSHIRPHANTFTSPPYDSRPAAGPAVAPVARITLGSACLHFQRTGRCTYKHAGVWPDNGNSSHTRRFPGYEFALSGGRSQKPGTAPLETAPVRSCHVPEATCYSVSL